MKASKKVTKKQTVKWQDLIVARNESLPRGVHCLFVSSGKSVTYAAKRKAAQIGVPSDLTVVKKFPLNEKTGKQLCLELLKSFERFPYGDSTDLVKASVASISRKYSQLSSKYPDQIELRRSIAQHQVDEQIKLLDNLKKKYRELRIKRNRENRELKQLESKNKSLARQIEKLQQEIMEFERQSSQLHDDKRKLSNEVKELVQHKTEEVERQTYRLRHDKGRLSNEVEKLIREKKLLKEQLGKMRTREESLKFQILSMQQQLDSEN